VNFDGIAEEDSIREHLSTLAGGRILDETPDDTEVPIDATGKVRPYIVLSIGVPFPTVGGGRSFSEGEKDIPYTLTLTVGCYAGDRKSLNMLYRAVLGKLVDWEPVADNDTALRVRAAVNGSSRSNEVRPAIVSKIVAMACTINMASG
jgi:hypothetical protein